MRAIAVNGSPRKNWNTASLLEHALSGATKDGAETELVHLYDLDFKGCISCFACKKIGGKSYGRLCSQRRCDTHPEESLGGGRPHPGNSRVLQC